MKDGVALDEWTLNLRKPVKLGNSTEETIYRELELKEPTLQQTVEFSKKVGKSTPIEAMKWLVGAISGVPPVVIDQIGIRDFNAAADYLAWWMTPAEKKEGVDPLGE